MSIHFLVIDENRQLWKRRCTSGALEDKSTSDINNVTCNYCIENMTLEEDMKYRLSKVPYSELETLVRRLASDCNVLDVIVGLHNLAKDIDKRLPTRWRYELEKRKIDNG